MKADANYKMTKATKVMLALMPQEMKSDSKSVLIDAEFQLNHVKRKMATKSFGSDSSE